MCDEIVCVLSWKTYGRPEWLPGIGQSPSTRDPNYDLVMTRERRPGTGKQAAVTHKFIHSSLLLIHFPALTMNE